jgi:hypothetical protein
MFKAIRNMHALLHIVRVCVRPLFALDVAELRPTVCQWKANVLDHKLRHMLKLPPPKRPTNQFPKPNDMILILLRGGSCTWFLE